MDINLWSSPGQLVSAVMSTSIIYLLLLASVRLVGRRTTAQLSAFDSLVTIALGTVLASTALPAHPAVADGAVVLATLLVMQTLIATLRRRSTLVRRLTDFAPKVVLRDGELEPRRGLGSAQLTADEVDAELRRQGVTSREVVGLLVLEPDGRFSIRPSDTQPGGTPLWSL